MISTGYLLKFKPFNAPLLQRLEVFNEYTAFSLLYTCLFFTEYVDHELYEDFREQMGWLFNLLMFVNMGVHLFFLGRSSCLNCKKKLKVR